MRIHSLSLGNFRGFDQIELTFENDVTVIAGVNGVGKSGILHALNVVFSRALPQIASSTAKCRSFTNEDIQYEKKSLTISAVFSARFPSLNATIHRERMDENRQKALLEELEKIQSEIKKFRSDKEKVAELRIEERNVKKMLREGGDIWQLIVPGKIKDADTPSTRPPGRIRRVAESEERHFQPLVISFSTQRQLPGTQKTLPRERAFSVNKAYHSALEDRPVVLREFMHWYKVVESGASEAHRSASKLLGQLKKVVHSFIPEFSNLRLEESPKLRFVVDKSGSTLEINQLSDGERGLLAIIFDITRRLSIANPNLEDPISEGSAIIMIDEIDLHLHPKWQRQVLGKLQSTFKNCQFIVTTHSPLVLGEVEARCVRFLNFDPERRVKSSIPTEAFGLDANRILSEQMGVLVRNSKISERLNELFEIVHEEDFSNAKRIIQELEITLGQNDPELTRANALIKFLEGENESN